MRPPIQRSIVWEWCDRPGLEHLLLRLDDNGSHADGLVMVALAGTLLQLRYAIQCDAQWRFRTATITAESNGETRRRNIEYGGGGAWTVDGAARPDLASCSDIDIMGTPFTNTMPIRRLVLPPEQPVALSVVYVSIPDLAISVAAQDYTRRGAGATGTTFRYRSLGSDFTAELSVDADGIVIDYGGIWRRRGG
ncbi:MAG TPA: putative glycolipid-binding domain-containing protein [Stellaceae bacterium]|jgi:hypothetical protein|nr:putative glycolipid-binding domain-containing protein [Stellaceae bacterium]